MSLIALVHRHPRLTLLLSLVVVVIVFWAQAGTKPNATTTAEDNKATLSVTVTRSRVQQWPLQVRANGNITAWQEAVVGTEIGGLRLTELLVDVGDRVHKGQLLARLQQQSVAAELAQSKATLAEAVAALTEATANAERARRVKGKGTMSEQQTANYLTAELTARARVDALRARVHSDEIHLAQTQVVAPDAGTISSRTATLGSVVQTGDELFRLIRGDRLEWRAELPAAELAMIAPGMPVTLTCSGNQTLTGKVRRIAPTLDAQSRNGLVYVDLSPNTQARAGMYARGEIILGQQAMQTLPQSALLLRDGFHYLFVLEKDQSLRQIKVTPGRRQGNEVAVLSGVDSDWQIVDSGVGFLNDGDRVKVVAPVVTAQASGQTTQPATGE